MLERMTELLKRKDLCVMATESGGVPHCSLMSYVASEDGREIYMLTRAGTKKYSNLQRNPNVSLLVDTREDSGVPDRPRPVALTVTGRFRAPATPEGEAALRQRLVTRHPELKQLADESDARVMVVRVLALQLLDGFTEAHFKKIP